MTTVKQRIEALEAAERDYEQGLRHASGQQRLEVVRKLSSIRPQIAMLREDERQPMGIPDQRKRFG